MQRLCRERGWTAAQFWALREDERLNLLAYDHYRQRAIAALIDSLTERDLLTPDAFAALTLARL